MAYLFIVQDNRVKPNTETLLISPFKEIWDRDSSIRKGTAILEFTYIEFMSSSLKSNPYKGYETVRRDQVLRDTIMEPGWQPDDLIRAAIDKVDEFQKDASSNYTLYLSAVRAKEKLQRFLDTCDLNERTRTNALILKPSDVSKALLDMDRVATALNLLQRKVEEDLYETTRQRANKEVSPFAKPELLNR